MRTIEAQDGQEKPPLVRGGVESILTLATALPEARNPSNSGCGNLRGDTRSHYAVVKDTHAITDTKTARIGCANNDSL
jgi:hypothetical protein